MRGCWTTRIHALAGFRSSECARLENEVNGVQGAGRIHVAKRQPCGVQVWKFVGNCWTRTGRFGVNLALMYQDAEIFEDFAEGEATRAVEADYTQAAAHLFLANSY